MSVGRWKLRLLVIVGILIALVWAAPMIAARTPLVGWVTRSIPLHGSVEVGSASLGWFSPVVLTDVTVRDADARIVATLPRVAGDRSLWSLLLDRSDLGSFTIEGAKIDCVFQGNESNLERLIAKTSDAPDSKADGAATTLPKVDITLVNATLHIEDADTKQQWALRSLGANARLFRDDAAGIKLNLEGMLADSVEPSSLKLEATVQNALAPSIAIEAKASFKALPLGLVNPIVRRYQPGIDASGLLHGQGTFAWSMPGGASRFQTSVELVATRLSVRTPYLADTIKLDRAVIPAKVRYEDGRLIADKLEIQSDVGKIALRGTLDLNRDLRTMLQQAGFELSADVNLATLAERLPKTLNLHHDLRMTGGSLRAECKSIAMDGVVVWQGTLKASDIRGLKGTQAIAWSDPITLDFQARDLHQAMPRLDRLRCDSRFLSIRAQATATGFTLTADADLAQLAEPLGQFIDLSGVKLSGKATAVIQARQMEQGRFEAQGNAQLKQLALTWLTKRPWQEPSVSILFDARGQTDAAGRQRIDAGSAMLQCGSDLASIKLTEPIADLGAFTSGGASVRVDGDLARWQTRSRAFTTLLDDWQLAGTATVQAEVRLTPSAIELAQTSIDASNFVCTGSSVWIHESTFSLQGAARWHRSNGEIELTKAKLACPTLRAESERLALQTTSLTLRGNAIVAGDLARLQQWISDPKAKAGESLAGTFAGRASVDTTAQRIATAFDVAVRDLVYGPTKDPTWREAEVQCVGRGIYDTKKDSFEIDQLQVRSALLAGEAKGAVSNLTTRCEFDLEGSLTYDLAKLEPQLRAILGKDVKIVGKDTRPFKLAGPLYVSAKESRRLEMRFTELKGNASVAWKSLKAYGCDIGPAEAKAILQQGWAQGYPIETSINGGKLRLQPNVRLDPDPMELILLAGPVIEKAQITPAMCSSALAYAMPALANVAEAEGSLSLALEGGRIPLSAPATSEVRGTFTLHTAKLGPSPLIRELSGLFKVPPPTSLVKECKVPFHMAQGKVHHKDLELIFPEFTLKSSGTVGLDGSLALVLETTIPTRLAQTAKLSPTQAKQFVRIPVGGTLDHPRLDPRALESLTAILGRSFLENQLNKLLQPKR